MNFGVRANSMKIQLQRSGLLNATMSLIAQGETKAGSSGAGTPTEAVIERFSQFMGEIKRNGTTLGQIVSAELTYSNNLDKVEVEGVSGGGLVKIRATAKGRILGVSIDESLLVPAEKSMLEDLIAAAINDARGKADAAAGEQMQSMTSGLQLPPGFKLPF